MRIGLREMKVFFKFLFLFVKDSIFFESCGVVDVIIICCKDCELFFCFFLFIVLEVILVLLNFYVLNSNIGLSGAG